MSSGGNEALSAAGELLAFGAVSATGTYTANLSYLERGLYGTSNAAHAIGEQFTLFDTTGKLGSTLVYDLPPQYIGQTLYLKFQSFNVFDSALEDMSTLTDLYVHALRCELRLGDAQACPPSPQASAASCSRARCC